MNTDFWCTKSWIIQDLPHQIWEAQTADGHTSSLIVRFFHNKATFWSNNLSRCYLSYWSVDAVTNTFTVVGLALLFIGFFGLLLNRKYKIMMIILAGPLFPLLELGTPLLRSTVYYICQVSAILIGLYYSIKWFRAWIKTKLK